jgi:hypothetical protein
MIQSPSSISCYVTPTTGHSTRRTRGAAVVRTSQRSSAAEGGGRCRTDTVRVAGTAGPSEDLRQSANIDVGTRGVVHAALADMRRYGWGQTCIEIKALPRSPNRAAPASCRRPGCEVK